MCVCVCVCVCVGGGGGGVEYKTNDYLILVCVSVL